MDQLTGALLASNRCVKPSQCSLTQRAGVGTWFRYAEVLQVLTQTIRFASVETEGKFHLVPRMSWRWILHHHIGTETFRQLSKHCA
jgi:hypothetical protein